MTKRHLLAGLIGAGVAGALALTLGSWPAASSGAVQAASKTVPGGSGMLPGSCGMHAEAIGYLGVLRTGQAGAARQALQSRLLAQVDDPAQHTTADLVRAVPGTSASALAGDFSRWLPVYPQARQGQLRCRA